MLVHTAHSLFNVCVDVCLHRGDWVVNLDVHIPEVLASNISVLVYSGMLGTKQTTQVGLFSPGYWPI